MRQNSKCLALPDNLFCGLAVLTSLGCIVGKSRILGSRITPLFGQNLKKYSKFKKIKKIDKILERFNISEIFRKIRKELGKILRGQVIKIWKNTQNSIKYPGNSEKD